MLIHSHKSKLNCHKSCKLAKSLDSGHCNDMLCIRYINQIIHKQYNKPSKIIIQSAEIQDVINLVVSGSQK